MKNGNEQHHNEFIKELAKVLHSIGVLRNLDLARNRKNLDIPADALNFEFLPISERLGKGLRHLSSEFSASPDREVVRTTYTVTDHGDDGPLTFAPPLDDGTREIPRATWKEVSSSAEIEWMRPCPDGTVLYDVTNLNLDLIMFRLCKMEKREREKREAKKREREAGERLGI